MLYTNKGIISVTGTSPVSLIGTIPQPDTNWDFIGCRQWSYPSEGYAGGGKIAGHCAGTGAQRNVPVKIGSVLLFEAEFYCVTETWCIEWFARFEEVTSTYAKIRAFATLRGSNADMSLAWPGSLVQCSLTSTLDGKFFDNFAITLKHDDAGATTTVEHVLING